MDRLGRATLACMLAAALIPAAAHAQSQNTTDQDKPVEKPAPEQGRATGLPKRLAWTFNFDAGWGSFGFANSLYINPRDPGATVNLSDQWFEGYIKPTLAGLYTLESGSQFFGTISAVGERTYGAVPLQFGRDISSFGPDDLSIGWRSGTALSMSDNLLEFTIGRAPYPLGHGMLLFDGAAEGGSRGGFWTNARKAYQFAAIGRFRPGAHLVEAFYLDRDDLPENETKSRVTGVNYEYAIGEEETTIGATYMRTFADAAMLPGRDGMDVFNLRAYTAPVPKLPGLLFEFEYASERNGDARRSNAWTAQAAYVFDNAPWTPTVSYRYALFAGDDPATAPNEAFDPLFPGFYDWGTWWQGEIAGEYFLANSNLASHQLRVHFDPADSVGLGVMFYDFRIPQPASYGPNVTSKEAAFELDAYTDWKLNTNFTISVVGAFADPRKAVEQHTGRTKNFAYGMLYVAYHF